MNTSSGHNPAQAAGHGARWLLMGLAGLVLAGCCFWTGLGAWLLGPLTPFWANHLSYVQGKAEVIAPAQWRPGGILSPDGRYMVAGWTRDGQRESFVWDLATDTHYPFTISSDALCWLNPDQFAVLDVSTNTYYLVRARDTTILRANWIKPKEQYLQPNGLARLHARWQAAEQIYVLENFSVSGYTVVTLEQGQPYVYRNFGTGRDSVRIVDDLTFDIPHVRIPDRCNIPSEPVYSPDGRFYARLSDGENAHVLIYSREGTLVAEAYKTGWDPRLMGWAYDSSGVYFQLLISGGAASMLVPAEPIFKLSPLTEEDARWAQIWTILKWIGGCAVVLTAGWWLLRRRRWPDRASTK